jgi:hypothetical protein
VVGVGESVVGVGEGVGELVVGVGEGVGYVGVIVAGHSEQLLEELNFK